VKLRFGDSPCSELNTVRCKSHPNTTPKRVGYSTPPHVRRAPDDSAALTNFNRLMSSAPTPRVSPCRADLADSCGLPPFFERLFKIHSLSLHVPSPTSGAPGLRRVISLPPRRLCVLHNTLTLNTENTRSLRPTALGGDVNDGTYHIKPPHWILLTIQILDPNNHTITRDRMALRSDPTSLPT